MSYKNLEIWQLARQLVIDIHKMILSELPKFEMVEEGAQIRRSVKSIQSNIVEENIIKIQDLLLIKGLIPKCKP